MPLGASGPHTAGLSRPHAGRGGHTLPKLLRGMSTENGTAAEVKMTGQEVVVGQGATYLLLVRIKLSFYITVIHRMFQREAGQLRYIPRFI